MFYISLMRDMRKESEILLEVLMGLKVPAHSGS